MCNSTDFIALHRLATQFMPTSESSLHNTINYINQQRFKYKSILFSSDTSITPLGPTSVFISNYDQSNVPIVIDLGASKSLSPFRSDFISFKKISSKIEGIGASSTIEGIGIVRWEIIDMNGTKKFIETTAYYVPSARIRLYSPQSHFKANKSGSLHVTHEHVDLLLPSETSILKFPFNEGNNLPLMIEISGSNTKNNALLADVNLFGVYSMFDTISEPKPFPTNFYDGFDSHDIRQAFTIEQNINLSFSQAELLHIHYCCGHYNMHALQRLISHTKPQDRTQPIEEGEKPLSKPIVFKSKHKNTSSCDVPKCAACLLAKMERRSKNDNSSTSASTGELKVNDLHPGKTISLDQYVVATRGRTLSTSCNESQMYSGGTIFVDHFSQYIFNTNQVSLRAGETLIGKRLLEREAFDLGFKLETFRADNGIFASNEFKQDVSNKQQKIVFSGVGAHHQNGVAERSIKTISYLARAMLIHSAIRWPSQTDITLWPFAFDHAIYIYNHLPGSDGLSPIEKWTNTILHNYNSLRRLHPWGCPVYVLDPKIQDGKKLPKFNPRSRQGKFLGFSKAHSTTVALVLNLTTKNISPQFHLLFDDFFTTVRGVDDIDDPILEKVDWENLFQIHGTEVYFDPNDRCFHDPTKYHQQPRLSNEWKDKSDRPTTEHHCQRENTTTEPIIIDLTNEDDDDDDKDPNSDPKDNDSEVQERSSAPSNTPGHDLSEGDKNIRTIEPELLGRGHRIRKPNKRYTTDPYGNEYANYGHRDYNKKYLSKDSKSFYLYKEAELYLKSKYSGYDKHDEFIQNLTWESSLTALAASCNSYQSKQFFETMKLYQDPINEDILDLHPLALSMKANNEDTPRWFEATKGENRDGFWEAMWTEINTLNDMNAWEQVKQTDDIHVIPSTWAFKIKRFPSGIVRKLKARFCVRGDMQKEGIDYFDSYAPVVQWSTVRTLLILSIILNLSTTQVDYTAAFCQAPIDTDVFISLPQGWQQLNRMGIKEQFKEGHVLKLKRSLYGLVQSPRNFFKHLKQTLETCNFRQSEHDPCLFYNNKVICLVYVDDCLFFSRRKEDIETAIKNIQTAGMDLNIEDDVAGFLGVFIERHENGRITLSQTGLIDRIIAALGLTHSNPTTTPAPKDPLERDTNGLPFSNEFNYASIVGMMTYLHNNSRPDIAFAVNQCARHTHRPTEKHAKYLKQIGRYLKGTKDKGINLIPSTSNNIIIECYVDADFAGLWKTEDHDDPHCVRSRAGHVIMINDCPIIWKSKLLPEITVSTMETEYVALSLAARELLPVQRIISEIGNIVGLPIETTTIHSTIWEDNEAALKLANLELPYMTNRSKHIGVKYHWFRALVGTFWHVKPIPTKQQIADIFTKGLPAEQFKALRERLMGW